MKTKDIILELRTKQQYFAVAFCFIKIKPTELTGEPSPDIAISRYKKYVNLCHKMLYKYDYII